MISYGALSCSPATSRQQPVTVWKRVSPFLLSPFPSTRAYVRLRCSFFVARVYLFPWRRPAALNGGRVVYLNGYWVAWLPALCPVGRKLTRVGQKKGAGIRKTNVDIVGAPIDPGVYTCTLYVPTWVRSFRASSTFLPLLFPFFLPFFFFRETFSEGKASVAASLETLRRGNELRL